MFVGDISLGEHFFSFGHGPRSFIEKGDFVFKNVSKVLSQADYIVGNLEGPLSDIGYSSMKPTSRVFRGSPDSVDQLKRAGFNILSVANNHSLQHGEACFEETVSNLQQAGIHAVGLPDEGNLGIRSIVLEQNGTKFGVIAASTVPDNETVNQIKYTYFSSESICNEIANIKNLCHFIIIVLHWGIEGDTSAGYDQKEIAKFLVDCGATIVVGHHPHVFFEIEYKDNTLVAYSLGNFVFDLPWDFRLRKSGILDVDIDKCGNIQNVCVWPVTLNINGLPEVAGKPVQLSLTNESYFLYKNNGNLKYQWFRKSIYLASFLWKGCTLVKLRFLAWKIKHKLNH